MTTNFSGFLSWHDVLMSHNLCALWIYVSMAFVFVLLSKFGVCSSIFVQALCAISPT